MGLADSNPRKRQDDFIDNCCGDPDCPNDCERLADSNPSSTPDEDPRFVCRREGHRPAFKVSHISGGFVASFFMQCVRCGEWIEVRTESA